MERRNFVKGLLAVCGAAAAGVAVTTGSAEAKSLDTAKDIAGTPTAEPAAAATTSEPDANGQYYIVRRRYYVRPRRRVYYYRRPVYYRRVYRPRYRIYW